MCAWVVALAVSARVTGWTLASVSITGTGDLANSVVQAWIVGAGIDIVLAVGTRVELWTQADVAISILLAGSSIQTLVAEAGIIYRASGS